jgi:hypothetical protein
VIRACAYAAPRDLADHSDAIIDHAYAAVRIDFSMFTFAIVGICFPQHAAPPLPG